MAKCDSPLWLAMSLSHLLARVVVWQLLWVCHLKTTPMTARTRPRKLTCFLPQEHESVAPANDSHTALELGQLHSTCVCVCARACVHLCVCVCARVHLCVCVCACVWCVCVYVCVRVCMSVCWCTCMAVWRYAMCMTKK